MLKNLICLTTLMFFNSVTLAFRPHSDHNKQLSAYPINEKILRIDNIKAQHNSFLESDNKNPLIQTDPISGEIRLLTGQLGKISKKNPTIKDYIIFSLKFVEKNFDLFKIKTKDLEIIPNSILKTKKIVFIRFHVLRQNIQIEDANISFRFSNKNLVQIANKSFGEAQTKKPQSFSIKELQNSIDTQFETNSISTLKKTTFRVQPNKRSYLLKKVATFNILTKENTYLQIQMDLHDNKAYEIKNLYYYLKGHSSAYTYDRWYQDSLNTHPLKWLNINLEDSSTFTDHNGDFLASSDSTPLIAGLMGQKVTIYDKAQNPIQAQASLIDNEWNLNLHFEKPNSQPWKDKALSQIMIYSKINEIVRFAKKYINPQWINTSLVANANLTSTCNAHWDGRTINLYSGSDSCANTGLIADVIWHEWGHGLDAATGGIEDGAFSEGIGDIVSMLMSRSSKLGIGFRVPSFEPVRDMEPDKIYPQDQGEVHSEGLIIGSTFWDLFKAFKKQYNEDKAIDLLANYIFKGIYTAPTYLDLYNAILIIDDDDDNPNNGSPNSCTINKIFSQHGLAEIDKKCLLTIVEDYQIKDTDKDSIIEPGESISLYINASNPGTKTLRNLTGELTFHPQNRIKMIQNKLLWEPIETKENLNSYQPAVFEISNDSDCGSKLNANISFSGNNQVTHHEIKLQVGKNVASVQSISAQNLPKPINDHETTNASFEFDQQFWNKISLAQAFISFKINHTYPGDLIVTLQSPAGDLFEIYKGSGRGSGVDFNQEITQLVKNAKVGGAWSLSIKDRAYQDQGELHSAQLSFLPAIYRCDFENKIEFSKN